MKNLRLFALLFLVLPLLTVAQVQEAYRVNLVYPTYSLQVEVLQDPGKYKPDQERIYYWLKSKDIHQSRGDFDGKLLHGKYTEFYLDKNLKKKGQFYKGLKDGEWKFWHANGELSEVVHWNKGQKAGLYKKMDEQGNVLLVSNFKAGKLHGLTISYENGKELRRTNYAAGEEVPAKAKKKLKLGKKGKYVDEKMAEPIPDESAPAPDQKKPKKPKKKENP